MGDVTGTGCALGSAIALYIAYAHFKQLDLTQAVVRVVKEYKRAGASASEEPVQARFTRAFWISHVDGSEFV